MKATMTRKEFLRSLLLLGAAALGGSTLAGCGGKEEEAKVTRDAAPPPKTTAADPCADVSGLTEAELTMRNETLKYVAVTPKPEQRCDNCKFWQPPEGAGPCGTCQLLKGPVNPAGYCVSWFTRET